MVNDILTEQQINAIVNIIRQQCNICADHMRREIKETYAPYMKGRKQYKTTGYVLSGFKIYENELPDMQVKDLEYCIGRVQPELICDKAILHIYFNTNNINTKIVKEHCKKYNANLDRWPIYAVVKYSVNKNCLLTGIQVVFLDAKAKTINSESIYRRPAIVEKSA